MTDWLTSWGEDIPETVRDHTNAHGGWGTWGAWTGRTWARTCPG